MNKMLKLSAMAAALVAMSGAAYGQKVETKGGLKVTSDDGQYSGQVAGRIHFDTNFYVDDDDVGDIPTDAFFRRARLTLQGHALNWKYKFENDFVSSDRAGFREMWIGTKVAGANLRLGQAKPYRGMEELTSSNEVVFMERPFATASGLFDGRQFTMGAFLDGNSGNFGWGTALYSLKAADQPANDGVGFNARVYFAPVVSDTTNAHVGLSYSMDNPDTANAANNVRARARAAGRAGGTPRPTFGTVGQDTTGSLNSTIGLEGAFQSGPFYVQGEYAIATFEQDGAPDVDVDTMYVQASFLLSGASKRYDVKKGVFKSPSVKSGTTELKVRYDMMENDVDNGPELTQIAVGFNHYFNGNVRAMVEYVMGEVDNLTPGTDVEVGLLSTRLQFSF